MRSIAPLITLALLDIACTEPPRVDPPADGGTMAHDGGRPMTDGNVSRDAGTSIEPPPTCNFASCVDNTAVSCDSTLLFDCAAHGGACAAFESAEGPLGWCTCGPIPEAGWACTGYLDAVQCMDGLALPARCSAGRYCAPLPEDPTQVGCWCDDMPDGICPEPTCPADPDCATCMPSCPPGSCGSNGCGGYCAGCPFGESCGADSRCHGLCTRTCMPGRCGPDGCGGTCYCPMGSTCQPDGSCTSGGGCMPNCSGGRCGDGCGGSCPAGCPAGATCAPDGSTCECPWGARVDYTFDGSSLDWTQLNYVGVRVTQIRPDGSDGTTDYVTLMTGNESETITFLGCRPNARVTRAYSVRGGIACEVGPETIMTSSVMIPAPTVSGSTCSAPPL